MVTRRPLDTMLGAPLTCGGRVGFLPDPPEGGTATATPPAAASTSAGAPAGDPETVTLTRAELQDRLTKLATKEKDQGMRSGAQEWARSLGFDSPDALAEIVKAHQDQQRQQMSEADRSRAEADEYKAQAHKALQDAKQARFDAKAQAALAAAGAQDPELAAPGLTRLGVTIDSTDEEIRAAVEKMKERNPGGFGPKQSGTPAADAGRPPAGSPAGSGNGQGNARQQADQVLDRLQNRRGGARIAG